MTRLGLILLGLLLCGCGPRRPEGSRTAEVASPISFRDVTAEAGVRWERVNGATGDYWLPETMGGGGAFLDYDNDGFLDILLVNGDWWPGEANRSRPTMALYRNNGIGGFKDITKQVGLDVSLQGMGVAVGDYDNDGWDDLYVTAVGGNRLFRNGAARSEPHAAGSTESKTQISKTDRVFRDVTTAAGVRAPGWGTSAAWVDIDGDGRLDLFVCSYVRWTPETDLFCGSKGFKSYCRPQEYLGQTCRLFRNIGNGRFQDVTKGAGIFNEGAKALGVCVLDLEDDGDMDLIVANDMEPNFVLRNDGKGRFADIGFESGISLDESGRSRAGMGIDSADWRGDGEHGLAIGNFSYEGLAFYPMTGAAPYAERSRQTGLFAPSYPYVTFGLAFADFDNDGRPDLTITNGHIEDTISRTSPGQTYEQPCVLYRNMGDAFTDVSKAAGEDFTRPLVGRGLCRGDFDNDGRIDLLLIPNKGAPRLLRNESKTTNHWISLRLVGSKSNRNGYGAKVTLEAGGRKQTAWCRSGSSYLSANDSRLHFGIGASTKIDRITVRWPSGRMQEVTDVKPGRVVRIVEGAQGEGE